MTWISSWRRLRAVTLLDEVVGEERRPLPGERAGERAAGHVLGDAVEQAGERDLLRSVRPVVGEDLVRPSPEEQGVHAARLFEHDLARLLVRHWRLPPAVREAAVAVLVGPSGRLCHSVERHELGHDEFAHGVILASGHVVSAIVASFRRGPGRRPGSCTSYERARRFRQDTSKKFLRPGVDSGGRVRGGGERRTGRCRTRRSTRCPLTTTAPTLAAHRRATTRSRELAAAHHRRRRVSSPPRSPPRSPPPSTPPACRSRSTAR